MEKRVYTLFFLGTAHNQTMADTVDKVDMIEAIKKRMEEIAHTAEGLYNSVTRDCPGLPSPTKWILNQANMRASWERYYHITNRKREPFRSIILRNSYSKYMRFMYESYPPGFGDEIIQAYKEERPFDGAVVYYHLTMGTD